jgi:fructosamine-3-kinase
MLRAIGSTTMTCGDALNDWLQQRIGATVRRRTAIGGGCIHHAWRLELTDGRQLFAKTNHADALPVLEAEAAGLEALDDAVQALQRDASADPPVGGLVIPRPVAIGRAGAQAVLILPWLELDRARPVAEAWCRLGASLAAVHRHSLEVACGSGRDRRIAFGWGQDNFIGSGHQANGWMDDWGRFFAQRRLAPQLEQLARRGQGLRGADALLARVPEWLADHAVVPCLVHGDLWSGNLALLVDGRGAIFDPAVYRGDREVDMAMARLFGGVPEGFFRGYEAVWPLPAGHARRERIYNLYHLLNHANLFGGGYRHQAQECISDLLRQGWS